MKLHKLDRRHKGYPDWKYFAFSTVHIPVRDRVKLFCDWREWCWQTWGASKELDSFSEHDLFDGTNSSNPHWCWLNDHQGRRRIYLRNDQDASAFSLQWT